MSTVSRLHGVKDAVRPALKARVMLAGPAGAGKTLSSLELAAELAEGGPVLVIDTEKESALTYADWFEQQYGYRFKHLAWAPPYDPRELGALIMEAGETYAAINVDSLSHFWRKSGGTLDIAEGKFSGWKVARPAQEDLLDAILSTQAHLIVCVRSKMEFAQETGDNGKQKVTKLGMAAQQDDTLEYEVNVCGQLDIEHRLTITKSRCIELPVGHYFHPGHVGDMAKVYSAWLKGGEPLARPADIEAIVARFGEITDEEARKAAKVEFVQRFGKPDQIRESRLEEARTWVAQRAPGEARQNGSSNGSPPEASSEAPPEPPAATGAADAEPQEAPRAGSPTRTVTEAQKLVLLFKEHLPNYDDDARHDVYSAATGRKITSGNDLNARERAKVRSAVDGLVSGALDLWYSEDGTSVLQAHEAGAA